MRFTGATPRALTSGFAPRERPAHRFDDPEAIRLRSMSVQRLPIVVHRAPMRRHSSVPKLPSLASRHKLAEDARRGGRDNDDSCGCALICEEPAARDGDNKRARRDGDSDACGCSLM